MADAVYNTPQWQRARARALSRDANRCQIARLFGGACDETLHVHHLTPLADGGDPYDLTNLLVVCSKHHPELEALRRYLRRKRGWKSCSHEHRTREGRELCERRLNRDLLPT